MFRTLMSRRYSLLSWAGLVLFICGCRENQQQVSPQGRRTEDEKGAVTQGISAPDSVPLLAILGENHQELGAVMDSLTGQHNTKHSLGAIGLLTNKLETRQTAHAHILRLALAPLRSPAYFDRHLP